MGATAEPRYYLNVGTENGEFSGTKHPFMVDADKKLRTKDVDSISNLLSIKSSLETVNNIKTQILTAVDRSQAITYADFGTKNQRITRIDYTAPSVGSGSGFTARKTITYSLAGNTYRRDSITWSLI